VKTIIYAGDALVTGDDIADAVLRYSKALAHSSEAETVEIPVVRPDGSRIHATLLIGPASQIVAEDLPDAEEELIDEELVARLDQRTRAMYSRAVIDDEPPPAGWLETDL
jgi:hypothetical protein